VNVLGYCHVNLFTKLVFFNYVTVKR